MRMRNVLPALLMGLAVAGLAVVPAPAADSPGGKPAQVSQGKIDKLVEQLGSDAFAERQEAFEALAKIGMPALQALRKAADSKDSEVRKRSRDLLVKLEREAASSEILEPTRVHLVYKDTPLKDAIADLNKKTGALIVLHDPDSKLKDRKITLDTGKTTFWDALDRFQVAAGVVEGNPSPAKNPPPPGGGAVGGAVLAPGVKINLAPAAPIKVPAKVEKAKPAPDKAPVYGDDEEAAARRAEEAKKRAAEAAAQAAKNAEIARKLAAQAKQAAKQAAQAGAIRQLAIAPLGGGVATQGFQPGQITLIPGKPAPIPTDASSSIRVRLGDRARVPVATGGKEVSLVLEVSPEPRLRWHSLVSVSIHKAIDNNQVKLKQGESKPVNNPNGGGAGFVIIGIGGGVAMPAFGGGLWAPSSPSSLSHYIPVKLVKGEKGSKSLTELSGTIAAYIQSTAEQVISAKDLMKAAGKTFKGKTGGEIKIESTAKNADGTVTIQFEFTQPEGFTAETQLDRPVPMPAGMAGAGVAAGGMLRIQLAVPPGGAVPGPAGLAKGATPMMNYAPYGLTLRDDKGNVLPSSIQFVWKNGRAFGGPGTKMDFIATYHPVKGGAAQPASLVFTGRKTALVNIPFSLKNVDLP